MVKLDEYQRLEVGVGVTVRGVGRALITKLLQAEPYVKAQVSIYEDQEVVAPSIGNEIEGGSAASEAAVAVAEKLIGMHEAMHEQEEKAQISSRVSKEISLDPRAMLAVDDFQAQQATQEGDVEVPPEFNGASESLMTRVRVARAARTKSLSLDAASDKDGARAAHLHRARRL
uniref:Uncharacterized protein n=1 Tax=Florenciella parvula TaxID=236787 RepID=A0A7S2FNI7_9STRA|mmetsp:Transcript_20194/g.42541  ORF Transcript_20194/g.42541 Transcript_20194/m.42541 type:complete len:173 (+) Transcript_20194:387-905(+)